MFCGTGWEGRPRCRNRPHERKFCLIEEETPENLGWYTLKSRYGSSIYISLEAERDMNEDYIPFWVQSLQGGHCSWTEFRGDSFLSITYVSREFCIHAPSEQFEVLCLVQFFKHYSISKEVQEYFYS